MKKHSLTAGCVTLGLILGISVFLTGCATTSSMKSEESSKNGDLSGKWSWIQEYQVSERQTVRWQGEFVLEKDGDSYTGTLDDISEGTYGDTIKDVNVVDDQMSFTRQGEWGMQQWKGTLTKEDGDLNIVDGQWTKHDGLTGTWTAHKID